MNLSSTISNALANKIQQRQLKKYEQQSSMQEDFVTDLKYRNDPEYQADKQEFELAKAAKEREVNLAKFASNQDFEVTKTNKTNQLNTIKLNNKIEREKAKSDLNIQKDRALADLFIAKQNGQINDIEFENKRKEILSQMMQKKADDMTLVDQNKLAGEIITDPTWNIKLPIESKDLELNEATTQKVTMEDINNLTVEQVKKCVGMSAICYALSGIVEVCKLNNTEFNAESLKGSSQWNSITKFLGVIKTTYSTSEFLKLKNAMPEMFKESNPGDFDDLFNATTISWDINSAEDILDWININLNMENEYRNVFGNTVYVFKNGKNAIQEITLQPQTITEAPLTESIIGDTLVSGLGWIGVALIFAVVGGLASPIIGSSIATAGVSIGTGTGIGVAGLTAGTGAGFAAGSTAVIKAVPDIIPALTDGAKALGKSYGKTMISMAKFNEFVGNVVGTVGEVGTVTCQIIVDAFNKVIKPTVDLTFNSYKTLKDELEPRVKRAIETTADIGEEIATEAVAAVRNTTTVTWNLLKVAGADAYNACVDAVWMLKTKISIKKQAKQKQEIAKLCPYLTVEEIDQLLNTCNNKHITPADSRKALNYYNKQIETINEVFKLEKLSKAKQAEKKAIDDFKQAKDDLAQAKYDANKPTELKDAEKVKNNQEVIDVKSVDKLNEPSKPEKIDTDLIDIKDINKESTDNILASEDETDNTSDELDQEDVNDVDGGQLMSNQSATAIAEDFGDDAFNFGMAGVGGGSTIGGILGGYIGGAAAGSVAPGIGTAIGAASGAVIGLVVALIKYLKDKKKQLKSKEADMDKEIQDAYVNTALRRIENKVDDVQQTQQIVDEINAECDTNISLAKAYTTPVMEDISDNKKLIFCIRQLNKISNKQVKINEDASFEIPLVNETSVQRMLSELRTIKEITNVEAIDTGKYDFSYVNKVKNRPNKYFTIIGQIEL